MSQTVLVADDSATIRKCVHIAFDKEPFSVAEAANGDDAIARAKELQPVVIFCRP